MSKWELLFALFDRIGALSLVVYGLYLMVEGSDRTQGFALMGWGQAWHANNRIDSIRRKETVK